MKTLILNFCIFFLFATIKSIASSDLSFSISGKINGLMVGDTLVFEKVLLPDWETEYAFTLIIEKSGHFKYEGKHAHSQYYHMIYKPLSREEISSNKRAQDILITSGDFLLKGTTDNIYYNKISGGVYDNPYLQAYLSLDADLHIKRFSYMNLMNEANLSGDTLKAREYSEKITNFYPDNEDDFEKVSRLFEEFATHSPSSEWYIIELLQKVKYTSLDDLQTSFEKMTVEAQESYYGKLLKEQMSVMAKLAPGNDAIAFNLTTLQGDKVSSADYTGRYILFYHWGLCPGSIMIDQEVIDLYNQYKEYIQVIGITDDIGIIKNLCESVKPDDEMMGVKLKPILENMIIHPWTDAESKGENKKITEDYAFAGLPFFILISPDNKIIARGFHDAFYKAKEIMQQLNEPTLEEGGKEN